MFLLAREITPFEWYGLAISDHTATLALSSSVATIDVPPGVRHPRAWSDRSDKYYVVKAPRWGPQTSVSSGEVSASSMRTGRRVWLASRLSTHRRSILTPSISRSNTRGRERTCTERAYERHQDDRRAACGSARRAPSTRRSGMLGTRGPIRGSGTFGGNTAAGRYPPGMDLRMSEDERQAFLAGVHI